MKLIKCLTILVIVTACNNNPKIPSESKISSIREEKISYNADSVNMIGFVAYDESIETKRPVILIIPEWWGLNDYAKSRARQLAGMGYLAMAIDMYGDGEIANDPDKAGELAGPFYKNPMLAKLRFDRALEKIKTYSIADTSQIASIGYCFGGAMALNIARLGENLKGVVSFHGNLIGVPPDRRLLKANILICHGENDQFVTGEEVAKFKKQMDSINAVYTFKSYPNATHAFTNPDATATGKKFSIPVAYNSQADTASWNEMKVFFGKIFK